MENRGPKTMAIAALILGVVGLTIGFAAFSTTLTINSSATVSPANDFSSNISFTQFTCVPAEAEDVTVYGTATATATSVTVDAYLEKPGDTVVCAGKVQNASAYDAYLTSVEGIAQGTCEAIAVTGEGETPATESKVQDACDDISLTVQIGSDIFDGSASTPVTPHVLGEMSGDVATTEDVKITIEYAADGDLVDGKFKVDFDQVVAKYSTAN